MLSLVERIVEVDFPFLGCCSGVGMLGSLIGATVDRRYPEPVAAVTVTLTEAGRPEPFFADLPAVFAAFGGHKVSASSLPADSVRLASSADCPIQAFRVGANAYATQFHPELDLEGILTRIDVYKNFGYFAPESAESLKAAARQRHIEYPPTILKRFVVRWQNPFRRKWRTSCRCRWRGPQMIVRHDTKLLERTIDAVVDDHIAAEELGLSLTDGRSLTVTGGLTFAVGPGNNYSSHAIATLVERLRADPDAAGLCTALGWYATKHAAIVMAGQPGKRGYETLEPDLDNPPARRASADHSGEATVEAYTVPFARDGSPEAAIVSALTSNGTRVLARGMDPELVEGMLRDDPLGRVVAISGGALN